MNQMPNSPILEVTKKAAEGALAFAKRLADGWYPSGEDADGNVVHDRHVLIHVRNHAYDLKRAAEEIERLRQVIQTYSDQYER